MGKWIRNIQLLIICLCSFMNSIILPLSNEEFFLKAFIFNFNCNSYVNRFNFLKICVCLCSQFISNGCYIFTKMSVITLWNIYIRCFWLFHCIQDTLMITLFRILKFLRSKFKLQTKILLRNKCYTFINWIWTFITAKLKHHSSWKTEELDIILSWFNKL